MTKQIHFLRGSVAAPLSFCRQKKPAPVNFCRAFSPGAIHPNLLSLVLFARFIAIRAGPHRQRPMVAPYTSTV
jgi:hypothetical protein